MEDEKNNIEPTFSIKGIDKKNEMDFIIDLINERIHEKNKFNEPDHEIKSNYVISTTYCFKQDI